MNRLSPLPARRLPEPGTPARRAAPAVALCLLATLAAGSPVHAWTPDTQQVIALEAARLAPPDLARQIETHRESYLRGVLAPFRDTRAERHSADPAPPASPGGPGETPGAGELDRVLAEEAARAVEAIRAHRPFEEIVHQLGVVSHYLADANNPLAADRSDPREGRYFADWLRYLESAEPRLRVVFYGLLPELEGSDTLAPLVEATLARSRALYPLVGREYERIGFASGLGRFDDRSTAFGVAGVAFGRAVSDIAEALRYIWLRAGGGDPRLLPPRGERLIYLPRAAQETERVETGTPRPR